MPPVKAYDHISSGTRGLKGGGGYCDNFHAYIGSGHFFGFKILNFNIFGGF